MESDLGTSDAEVGVPGWVRATFAHAAVQILAEGVGADVLHLKGAAADVDLRTRAEGGSDADVLVRPAHVEALLDALWAHGWSRYHDFRTGSAFEHATTALHPHFTYADVHRIVPGLDADPEVAFEALWRRRQVREIAGLPCQVPDRTGQALVAVLNDTRGRRRRWTTAEIDALVPDPADLAHLVEEVDARVAIGAATGDLERFRGHRTYWLWKAQVEDTTRVQEWAARVRAAGSWRAGLGVAVRAPLVNLDRLTDKLGHRPSRAEVAREFLARPVRGAREEWSRWRSR